MKKADQQVVIQSDVQLKGTMTFPATDEGRMPAVLILAGSGNLNRDGNQIKGKFKFNLYHDLAELLTSLGFITLRYDKRGVGESEGDYIRAGLWDAVRDAEAAVEFLAAHPDVDSGRIIVLGHSEGCIVGTALNGRMPVNGLILLSGGGGSMREQLELQREQLFRELDETKGLKGLIIRKFRVTEKNELKAQKLFRKMTETDKDIIRATGVIKLPAKYFREHFQYDIVEGIKKINCPVLAINGLKDFQAGPHFLERIPENAKGAATCVLIENMDHGLKEQLTPMSASNFKKNYLNTIGKPIHPEAVNHLTSWLIDWKENKTEAS